MPKVKDDEPLWLPVGTAVSARYHGAYCEAYVMRVKKTLRCRIRIVKPKDQQNNVLLFTDDAVQTGVIGISNTVSVKDATGKILEGRILAVEDQSEYHVRFNDGDEKTLRRSAITPRSGKHFGSASEPNIAAVLAAAVASAAGAAPPTPSKSKPISKTKSDGAPLHAPAAPEAKKLTKKKSSDVDTPPKASKAAASAAEPVNRDPPASAPIIIDVSPARRGNKSTPSSSRPTFPASSSDSAADKTAKDEAVASSKLSTPSRGDKRTPSKKTRRLEGSLEKKSKAFRFEDISDDAEDKPSSRKDVEKIEKDSDSDSESRVDPSAKRKKIHRKKRKRLNAARRAPVGSPRATPRKKAAESDEDDADGKSAASSADTSDSSDAESADKNEEQQPAIVQRSSKTTSAKSSRQTTPRRKPGTPGRRPSAAAVGLSTSRITTPSTGTAKKRRLSKLLAAANAANSDTEKKPADDSAEKSSLCSPVNLSDDEEHRPSSTSDRKRRSTNNNKGTTSSPGTPKSPPLLVSAVSGSVTPTTSNRNKAAGARTGVTADDPLMDVDDPGVEESPSPSNVPPPPPLLHADGSLFSPTSSSDHNMSFTASVHAQHTLQAESIAPPMLRLLDDTSNYEIGKLVIIEVQTRKQSLPYVPAIVVHPMATKRIRAVDVTKDYIVRSLADNSFLKLSKGETQPLIDVESLEALIPSTTSDSKARQLYNITKSYMREGKLPTQWNEKVLFEGAAAADHDAESVVSSTTTTPRASAAGPRDKRAKDAVKMPSISNTGASSSRKIEEESGKKRRGRRPRRRRTLSNESASASSSKTDTTHSSSTTTKTVIKTEVVEKMTPQSPPPMLLSTVMSNLVAEAEQATPPPVAEVKSENLGGNTARPAEKQQQPRSTTPASEPSAAVLADAAMTATTKTMPLVLPLLSMTSIAELPTLPAASVYPPMRYSPISPAKLPSSKTSPPHVASSGTPTHADVMSPPSFAAADEPLPTLDDLPTLPAAPTLPTAATSHNSNENAPISAVGAALSTSRSASMRGRTLSTVSAAGSNSSSQDTAALSPRKRAYRDAMRTEKFQSQRKQVDFDALKPGAEIKLLYQNPKTQHIDAYTARVTDTYNDAEDDEAGGAERRGRLVFVHYHGWNQRFDEWVDASRILHVVSTTDAGSAAYAPTTSYHNRALARLTSKKFTSSSSNNTAQQPRRRLASGGNLLSKQQSQLSLLRDDAVISTESPAGAGKPLEFDSESISSSATSDVGSIVQTLKKPTVVAIDLDIGNSVHVDDSDAATATPTSPRKGAFFSSSSVLSPLHAPDEDVAVLTSAVDAEPARDAVSTVVDDAVSYSKPTSPSSMSVVSSVDEHIPLLVNTRATLIAHHHFVGATPSSSSSSTSRLLLDASSSKNSSRPHSSSIRTAANASDSTSSLTTGEEAVVSVQPAAEKNLPQPVPSHHLPLYSSTLPFSMPDEMPVSGSVLLRDTRPSSDEADELQTRSAKRSQRFSRLSVENQLSGGLFQTQQSAGSSANAAAPLPPPGKRKHADLSALRTPQERARLKSSLSSAYNILTRQLEHDVPISTFPLPEHALLGQQQRTEQVLAECYRDAALSLNVVHNPLFVPHGQRVLVDHRGKSAAKLETSATNAAPSVNWRHVKKLQATLSNECSVKSNEYCVPLVGYAAQYYDALGRLKLPLDGSRKTGYLTTSSALAANFKADESRRTKDGSSRTVVVEGVELTMPPTNLSDAERLKSLENLQQKLRLMYQIKQRRVVKMLKIREEIRLKEIKSMRKDLSSGGDAAAMTGEIGEAGDDDDAQNSKYKKRLVADDAGRGNSTDDSKSESKPAKVTRMTATEAVHSPRPPLLAGS